MALWKKIWIALLLAIAGTGQLPLWLHDSLCHHHGNQGDHTSCSGHRGACLPACQTESNDDECGSNSDQSDCPWGHVDAATQSGSKLSLRWSAGPSAEDHNCAACYFLSQSITVSALQSYEPPVLLVAELGQTTEGSCALDLLAVYASRAPPAV